jgi:hypothetical protein
MRDASTEFTDALFSARDAGIRPRKMVWITAHLRGGSSVREIGYWGGDEDITVNVQNGEGDTVERTYFGNGELVSVDPIVYVSDLSIKTTNIVLQRSAPNVQTLTQTYDPRLAAVEIHDALMVSARSLAAPPELVLWGIVNGAPRTTPGIGRQSTVTLRVVPAGIRLLTKTNPARRSYESQRTRRSGDEFFKYTNSAYSWERNWGEASTGGGGKK